METYNDWLAHHGIPGMHWGERNGPPYPLRPMQYTKEELREKKKAAAGYNKEIRGIQNSKEYRKGDKAYSKIRKNENKNLARAISSGYEFERFGERIDERRQKGKDTSRLEERRAKLVEKSKSEDEKIRNKNKEIEEKYKESLDAYRKGNEKVKEILDRAETEGGFDLRAIKKYAQTGESIATNVLLNSASFGALMVAKGAGVPFLALFGDLAPNETKVELTDRYKLKVGSEYKNKVKENEKSKNSDYGKELKNIYDTAKTDEEKDRRVRELDKKHVAKLNTAEKIKGVSPLAYLIDQAGKYDKKSFDPELADLTLMEYEDVTGKTISDSEWSKIIDEYKKS